jgi:hemolysin III
LNDVSIDRQQSVGEEIANSVSHGLALVAAVTATPFLIGATREFGGTHLIGSAVFAATMMLLYLTSTLYHALHQGRGKRPWISTGLYLVMGWLALIAIGPLVERVPAAGLAFIVAGGLAYTVGVVFFMLDSRVRYAHAVWHGFVAAGTGFHVVAVLRYAA